ncbi:unnamed protein product [Symbiodinium sp. CCMP2592]|nr:unnamed protein product [Symbiodinium sp. CCMP2592]
MFKPGGTGFRGHYTTERLVREGHNVTVVSRGAKYWDVFDRIAPHVTHWRCNRTLSREHGGGVLPKSSGLVNCTDLVKSDVSFDAVVDFSTRTLDEMKQAIEVFRDRVLFYVFISSHAVYDVSKNRTHQEPFLLESDAVRPGREISPLDRWNLKGRSTRGDNELECEEELLKQYNAGGFPYVTLRLGNVFGPKENTIRYWLLHLWVKACVALTLPLHVDTSLVSTRISMTYTPDIAEAVVRAIARGLNETCCPEKVHGEAFNLACEEMPTQRELYNYIGEPAGVPYVETIETPRNHSVVLYPDNLGGPISVTKAQEVLRWSPTGLSKALRSVARFYERIMLEGKKHKGQIEFMYRKMKAMLGGDGPRFVEWTRAQYAERRKTELYDELDDEDEDEIILARSDSKRPGKGGQDAYTVVFDNSSCNVFAVFLAVLVVWTSFEFFFYRAVWYSGPVQLLRLVWLRQLYHHFNGPLLL